MRPFYVTTSWDDGAKEDIKLAEMLAKYEIPATFYIPIKNPEREVIGKKEIKQISTIFEIGGHTYNHIDLKTISLAKAEKEIQQGKEELENIIGSTVTSFAYPKGNTNVSISEIVGLSGFTYARSTSLFQKNIGNMLNAGTTIHAYNHSIPLLLMHGIASFSSGLPFLKNPFAEWIELAKIYFDYVKKNGGIFHLWGHSWELEKYNQWSNLESVLRYISTHSSSESRITNSGLIQVKESVKADYYEKIDPNGYNKLQQKNHGEDLEFLSPYLNAANKKGNKILDVGCGTGRFAELISNANYYGVDFSFPFIKYAQKKYKQKKNVTFIHTNLLKFPPYKYDLIVWWGTLEDCTDPYLYLTKSLSLLSPSGKIIVSLHNSSAHLGRLVNNQILQKNFPYTEFSVEGIESFGKAKAMRLGVNQKVFKHNKNIVLLWQKN